MKHLILSASAFCLLIAVAPVAAHAADESYSATTSVKEDAAGNMKKEVKEEAVNAAGTKETSMSTEKVEAGKDSTKTEVTTKDTVDPKGMGNKAVTESKEVTKTDDKGNAETKSTTETKAADGANDKVETKATVKHTKHGKKTTKTETTEHDPKGLMNKETTKTTDTSEVKADGTTEASHKAEVNGKTVEETKTEAK